MSVAHSTATASVAGAHRDAESVIGAGHAALNRAAATYGLNLCRRYPDGRAHSDPCRRPMCTRCVRDARYALLKEAAAALAEDPTATAAVLVIDRIDPADPQQANAHGRLVEDGIAGITCLISADVIKSLMARPGQPKAGERVPRIGWVASSAPDPDGWHDLPTVDEATGHMIRPDGRPYTRRVPTWQHRIVAVYTVPDGWTPPAVRMTRARLAVADAIIWSAGNADESVDEALRRIGKYFLPLAWTRQQGRADDLAAGVHGWSASRLNARYIRDSRDRSATPRTPQATPEATTTPQTPQAATPQATTAATPPKPMPPPSPPKGPTQAAENAAEGQYDDLIGDAWAASVTLSASDRRIPEARRGLVQLREAVKIMSLGPDSDPDQVPLALRRVLEGGYGDIAHAYLAAALDKSGEYPALDLDLIEALGVLFSRALDDNTTHWPAWVSTPWRDILEALRERSTTTTMPDAKPMPKPMPPPLPEPGAPTPATTTTATPATTTEHGGALHAWFGTLYAFFAKGPTAATAAPEPAAMAPATSDARRGFDRLREAVSDINADLAGFEQVLARVADGAYGDVARAFFAATAICMPDSGDYPALAPSLITELEGLLAENIGEDTPYWPNLAARSWRDAFQILRTHALEYSTSGTSA